MNLTRHHLLGAAVALAVAIAAPLAVWFMKGSNPLAVLDEADGPVEGSFEESEWEAVEPGAEFRTGDALRTGEAATARLSFATEGHIDVEPRSLVRFAGADTLDLELGEISLAPGSSALRVTGFGASIVVEDGRARLRRTEDGLLLSVEIGNARVIDSSGEHAVRAGGEYFVPPQVVSDAGVADAGSDAGSDAGGTTAAFVVRVVRPEVSLREGERERELAGTVELDPSGTLVVRRRGRARIDGAGGSLDLRGPAELALGGAGFGTLASGSADLVAAADEASIRSGGATIVARGAGSEARVRVGDERTRVSVERGEVEIRVDGEVIVLRAGEEHAIEHPVEEGALEPSPGRVDLVIGAGSGATVHDPSPPTAVGIEVRECPRAIVEIGRSRFGGEGRVDVLVPRGSHRYVVRCAGARAPVATGRIAVLRDAGTAPLAPTAATSRVDVAHSAYRVQYTLRLPEVAVTWSSAPEAPSYRLTHVAPDGTRNTYSSARPERRFASGSLAEGTHTFRFEASNGFQSRDTRVAISFQADGRTAVIQSPGDRTFAPGERVDVRGLVLHGWDVSVAGGSVAVAADDRFSGSATAPGDGRAIAIRLVSPGRGVHYYLRRPR